MRSLMFSFPREPNVVVTVTETADGNLEFLIEQSSAIGVVGDLRGLFFHIADESLLSGLAVVGDDVTNSEFSANEVANLGNGANVNGLKSGPFDIGIEFGTAGIGTDDIQTTTFTLSHTSEDLSLELIGQQTFAARLTSVGTDDKPRTKDLKTETTAPEAPPVVPDIDAVVVNGIETDFVWLNEGIDETGQLQFTGNGMNFGQFAFGVSLADFDNDGDLDVFTEEGFSFAQNEIWLNEGLNELGQVIFIDSGLRLGRSSSKNDNIGDLDGDGDLDIFSPGFPYRVWLNEGIDLSGDLQFTENILAFNGFTEVALGDLDGDGDLDVFVTNPSAQPDQVLLNEGLDSTGQIQFVDSGLTLGNTPSQDVALGDLDGDGDLDAVVGGGRGVQHKIWLNEGLDGTGQLVFVDSGVTLGTGVGIVSIELGDLDADGDFDVVIGDSPNPVWLNNGVDENGQLQFTNSGVRLGSGALSLFDVGLGDLDGDGDLDAYLAGSPQTPVPNEVWLNEGLDETGELQFVDSGLRLGNSAAKDVALGDIDGDGSAPIVTASGLPYLGNLVPYPEEPDVPLG